MAGYVSSRALRLQSKAQSLTAIFHKELYNISSCGVAILAMIVSIILAFTFFRKQNENLVVNYSVFFIACPG